MDWETLPIRQFEIKNVAAIRAALDQHNTNCRRSAEAICLNPTDHKLLGYDELWGVPVVADPDVSVKNGRIKCSGRGTTPEFRLDEAPGDA